MRGSERVRRNGGSRVVTGTRRVCALLLALAPFAVAAGESDAVELRAERLEAAVLAERRVQRELDARVAAGGLGGEERAAYQAQLDRLRDLIRRLHGGATGVPADGAAAVEAAAVLTPDERTATLDEQLQDSIGEFDEMLLREQRELARRSRAAGGGGGAGAGAVGGAGAAAGTASAAGAGGATAAPAGTWSDPGRDAAAQEGEPPAQSTAAGGEGGAGGAPGRGERKSGTYVAGARADASDDDVVARQLREAAESETDPELRERLWEEYRRYKESRR